MTSLHRLRYTPGRPGCPSFLSGDFVPDEFEWEPGDPAAIDVPLSRSYEFRSKVGDVDFDFYAFAVTIIGSDRFVAVCKDLNVRMKAVGLKLSLPRGAAPKKHYSIVLPGDYVEVLDREHSVFVDATNMETGAKVSHPRFPEAHNYEKIEVFVPRAVSFPPLFTCIETGDIFCSGEFMEKAISSGLLGVAFEPIDSTYSYDPIGSLLEP